MLKVLYLFERVALVISLAWYICNYSSELFVVKVSKFFRNFIVLIILHQQLFKNFSIFQL